HRDGQDRDEHRSVAAARDGMKSVVAFVNLVVFVALLAFVVFVAPTAAQLAGRPTRPQVTPPQGPPRQGIFKHCTSCHGIDDYAYNALDGAGWDAHLTTKHRGVDVPLPAQERAILLDWLAERFGPT